MTCRSRRRGAPTKYDRDYGHQRPEYVTHSLARHQKMRVIDEDDAYDRAIDLDPAYAAPWNGKGFTLENQGNYTAAIEAYDRAIALDPQSVEAKQNRERVIAKAQGSQKGTPSTMAMPAGEPVPFVNLFALAIGAVGLALVSRSRGN